MAKPLLLYGLHAIESVLEQDPGRVLEIFLQTTGESRKAARTEAVIPERFQKIARLAREQGVAINRVEKQTLEKLVHQSTHQGVVARCRPKPVLGESELRQALQRLPEHSDSLQPPLFLVLDTVTDPHNLGACLRNADAFGVQGVIAPRDKAAGLTPTVHKVSCGAAETVPFYQVTNLVRALEQLKEAGIWVAGAAIDAQAENLLQADLSGPLALVLGAEGSGLRPLTQKHCDRLLYLPMQGWVDSVNVSVACGIFLAQIRAQAMKISGN